MTREEALVKIGSAATLISDVAENYTDEIGRGDGSISKEQLPTTPLEKMIKACSRIVTDTLPFLKCEDETEYIGQALELIMKAMTEQSGRDKDGGNNDDVELPF